jgi:hypothetical protein
MIFWLPLCYNHSSYFTNNTKKKIENDDHYAGEPCVYDDCPDYAIELVMISI